MKFKASKGIPDFHMDATNVAAMKPPHKNIAIAMVAACIVHYWSKNIELETIYLDHGLYELYKDAVRRYLGDEAAETNDFYWHDIAVKKRSIYQKERLTVEVKKPKEHGSE